MDVIFKKRLRQLATVVLVATILPYVSFPIMPHFLFVVATDSMSPTINCGDIVIIFDSTVSNGSIVVFRNPINEGYEVHRICGVQRVGNRTYYVTKGDMVNQTDSFLIPQENVVGVVSVIVPYIGLHYLIPRLHTLLITMSLIVLYVTIAFYETRRWSPGKGPEDKTSRNRKRLSFHGQKEPTAKKMGAAALALFLVIVLVQPPLMLAGINLVYPQSQHSATVTTPKIALQNGIAGSSTIGDGGNSATVTVSGGSFFLPQSYANLGGTTNDGAPIGNLQSSDNQYVTFNAYESWWNPNYKYRRKIKITNSASYTLPPGYSVKITVDTTGPKFLDNGNDLRIVYAVTNTELDRVSETAFNAVDTEIWFKTQSSIPAGGEDDSYYMYYGYSGAGSPPADRSQVYLWFDDFSTNTTNNYNIDRHANDWHGSAGNVYKPYWDSTNNAVYYDTGDNYAGGWMPNTINEANVYAEMKMRITGSYPTNTTNGILLRWQNKDTFYGGHISGGSYSSPCLVRNGRTTYIAYKSPSEYHVWNQWFTFAVAVSGSNLKLWVNGVQKVSGTDTQITSSGKISFLVAQSIGWMDDFKIRKYVDPEPSTSLGLEEITWWNSNYQYRKRITVTAGTAAVPSGYSVPFTENTASLITAGKLRSDGRDFRVLYWNGASWVELDRDVYSGWNTASTVTWFKLQASIAASGSDSNYYIYYGYSGETGTPPANRSNVYVFWDDFDDGSISDWTIQAGTWSAATDQYVSGPYSLKATTGSDSWIKPNAIINEADVELEVYMRVAGGGKDWAIAARVQSGASMNWYEINPEGTDWALAKMVSGSWTSIATGTPGPDANVWYRVALRIKGTQAQAWVDGSQRVPASGWANIGTEFSSGSIALRTWDIGTGAWYDNVKLRKFVDPEPTTIIGSEETPEYTADWYCSFTGVSLSNVAKFTLTFEGQYSDVSVTQRLYLYSFADSAWMLFDTFTTSSTPSTDQTRTFDLTADLSKYVSAGEVRLRVGAMKRTSIQFQCKADYTNLMTTKTYDYVLKVANQVGYAWSIFLAKSSDSNIARLSNVTIWLHNGGGISKQIQIISGSYTQTSGSSYTLTASGTDYIAITAVASAAGTSEIVAYLKAEIPGSGIHVQLQITFQIT